jgi:pimeloyl-ACP methyl ester carboxylesterase
MHQEFQLNEFETNGIRVRAVVEETGPLVVMVHGFPELWYSWRHQIKPVAAAGYRVVAPDVRGYGGSDKPHEVQAYDMETLMNDVVGLVDALGEEKALELGFFDVGFTTADPFSGYIEELGSRPEEHYGRWITERFNLVDGARVQERHPWGKSIIVLLKNYHRRRVPPQLAGIIGRGYLVDERVTKRQEFRKYIVRNRRSLTLENLESARVTVVLPIIQQMM